MDKFLLEEYDGANNKVSGKQMEKFVNKLGENKNKNDV